MSIIENSFEYIAVLDISSVIWDQDEFDTNSYHYYKVLLGFSTLLNNLSTENILMRKELSYQLMQEFPFREIKNLKKYDNKFWDIGRIIYSFIGKINNKCTIYPSNCISNIRSKPNVIKQNYNDTIKLEICYLLSKMHTDDEIDNIYFTFDYLWNGNNKLQTEVKKKIKTYKTIISDRGTELEDFFKKLKPKFDHNKKHDCESYKTKDAWFKRDTKKKFNSQLSCYYTRNDNIPQKILDKSIKVKGEYIGYDGDNEVFVRFRRHKDNLFHGFDEYDDENIEKIPFEIKARFRK